ncbi:MAG: acyl carrier protein [Deltaproteobacteria bacterium]|nr:acyl carrier protein [Candidatus Zymogenaceae bacterium]
MSKGEVILSYIREELLDYPDTEIHDDTSLFQDRVLKSINLVQLIVFIEETYNIKVKPSEVNIENFDSIAKILRFLGKKSNP